MLTPLTPTQQHWIKEEIAKRKHYKPIPHDEESQRLAETHKEVIRVLNKLDGDIAGTTLDDFDTLVNVIHRSASYSLLKQYQEKWRAEALERAHERIERLEKKRISTDHDTVLITIEQRYILLLQKLKIGAKALGKNKADFDRAMKKLMEKAHQH